jgi:hypothetical protein
MGLPHRYCDPDNPRRRVLKIRGITNITLDNTLTPREKEEAIAADHAKRERYWYQQLLAFDNWPVLFVCGADHVDSLCSMLKNEGIDVHLVARDWPTG